MNRIGVIGAGQLGRMLALAGAPLNMQFSFLDPAPDACAQALGTHICAAYDDKTALRKLAEQVDLITFEFESVPAAAVDFLSHIIPVYPSAQALRIAQDRWLEKSLFTSLDIPIPAIACINSQNELDIEIQNIGLPAVLKTRTLGYDGKGQKVLRTHKDIVDAFKFLNNVPCILEKLVSFDEEVSLVSVRARSGEIRYYPLTMNQHQQGILDISVATNQHPLQNLAEDYARRILEKLNYIGVMTIEFFQKDDVLSVNEIAPRVHNSGHWTIDGAKCSQFENHLRAINDLPLGSTQRTNNSAMLNLISHIPNVEKLLDIENCHLHHYGKTSKPGRKVGHVTLCESTENELAQKIKTVQAIIQE